MNFYSFHIGDYARSTRHLSWEEDLAYRRLLDAYYSAEQPLPNDAKKMHRLALAATKKQRNAVDVILNEFFELTEEGWRHKRCDQEIITMQDKKRKQSEKASKRWAMNTNGSFNIVSQKNDAAAMPQQCHNVEHGNATTRIAAIPPIPIPIPIPIPNNKKIYNKKKCDSADATRAARPSDVDEDVWRDFLAIRKAKRAPLTPKALEGIQRETQKAGIALNDALLTCVERGWQGFSAEWITRKPTARIQPESFASVDYGVSGDI